IDETDRSGSDRNDPAVSHAKRVQPRRAEDVRLAQADHLPSFVVASHLHVKGIGSNDASTIEEVSSAEGIFRADNLISLHSKEVLVGRKRIAKKKRSRIAANRAIRNRIKLQIRHDRRRDSDVSSDQNALARAWRWHGAAYVGSLQLPKTFIISGDETVILDDGAAAGRAKLVAPKLGDLIRLIEFVAGIESAISQEFIGRAMPFVAAAARDRIHHTSGSLANISAGIRSDH